MDVLDRLEERFSTVADRAVGTPIERDGATVVPLVSIRGGGGGGSGQEAESGAEGSGGGWGAIARPIGAYVIRGGSVEYVPALDVTRIVVGGQLLLGLALLLLRRVVRRRRG